MSDPTPPRYVFGDNGIAIFSSVILAVTLLWQVILAVTDCQRRGGRRFRSIRANAILAFLSTSIGISTIAGWPQSQNIASMMVYIMAQASSIGWLEHIQRAANPAAAIPAAANQGMSGEDKVAKVLEVFAVFLTTFLVWNNSFTYNWIGSHDLKRLVYLTMALETMSTIVGGLYICSIRCSRELGMFLKVVITLAAIFAFIIAFMRVVSMFFPYWLAMSFGLCCVIVGGLSVWCA